MLKTIEFFVPGNPGTAGSKRAMPIYRGSKGAKIFTGKTVVIPANTKGQHEWMAHVRHAGREAYKGPLLECAITLEVTFQFLRPKSHYGTGRNKQILKPGAPRDHIQDPDRTKLLRALEDALTGIIWRDDNQIIGGDTWKIWSIEKPGAQVHIFYDCRGMEK